VRTRERHANRARETYDRALVESMSSDERCMRVLGPEHTDTLNSARHFGLLPLDLGRARESAELLAP
jgi:hypothetical protein